MSFNWNVYKVFSNGKRAKAPMYAFEYESENNVESFFENKIKKILVKKFGSKISNNNFSVIRADLSQERKMTENLEEKNKNLRRQVFQNKMNDMNCKEKMVECVLLFSSSTNWTWQWCAVHSATTVVRARISPEYHTYEAAQQWMNEEVEKL